MTKLFMTFIYILIFLILEIMNQECPKEEPIYTSDGCGNIY